MNSTEKFFRAMGFYVVKGKKSGYYFWVDADGLEADFNQDTICETEEGAVRLLPNITQSFPAFKEWVLVRMQKAGYGNLVVSTDNTHWVRPGYQWFQNEILEAAVVAATRYLRGKK